MAVSPPVIDLAACERLVGVAAKACPAAAAPATTPVPTAPQPEWDALASSFASLGAALAWGSVIFALIALVGGIAWAKLVRGQAKDEAKRCAEESVKEWLAKEAPQIIRQHVEWLRDTSLGNDDDDDAADAIGKEAG